MVKGRGRIFENKGDQGHIIGTIEIEIG